MFIFRNMFTWKEYCRFDCKLYSNQQQVLQQQLLWVKDEVFCKDCLQV